MTKTSADEWHEKTFHAYERMVRAELHPLCPLIIGQAGTNYGKRPRTAEPIRRDLTMKERVSSTAMFPNPRTSAGYRLFKMTGLTLDEYLQEFERFNTLPYFPGCANSRGHKFPRKDALEWMEVHIVERRLMERPCVIIGKGNAQIYFGRKGLPEPLTWERKGKEHWLWMPHTSGIVQFWNKQEGARARVAEIFADLKDYVPEDN